MKIKFTCNINNLYDQFTVNGLHHSFIDMYAEFEKKKTEFSQEYFEVIATEVKGIKKTMQMITENDKRLKTKLQLIGPTENTQVNEVLWDQIRTLFIEFAVNYRMKYDSIFRHILQSLNNEHFHLTYSATANNAFMESGKTLKEIMKVIGALNAIKLDPAINLSVTSSVAAPSVAAPSVAAPSIAAPSVAAQSIADAPKPADAP
jgi:hypothetical protein